MKYLKPGLFILFIALFLYSIVSQRLMIDDRPSTYEDREARYARVQMEILNSYDKESFEWFHAALMFSHDSKEEKLLELLKIHPKNLGQKHLQLSRGFLGHLPETIEALLIDRFKALGMTLDSLSSQNPKWSLSLSSKERLQSIDSATPEVLGEIIQQKEKLSPFEKSKLVLRIVRDCSEEGLNKVQDVILEEKGELMIQTYLLALKKRGDYPAVQLLERLSTSPLLSVRLQTLAHYLSQIENLRKQPEGKCIVS